MPSTSKSQQRLMGMVHAYQKGELKTKGMDKDLLSKIKNMAKQMKPKSVKDFAETKHNKLPQKVEKKMINFKYFSLLEYVNNGEEMNMVEFLNTINDETDIDILAHLLELIYSKKKYQDEIDNYYKDNKNMLKFPVELAKETDEETIDYIDKIITKRINDIKDDPSIINKPKKKEKEKRQKIRKIGYHSTNDDETEPLIKQDIKTAYKRTSKDSNLGYKFRHMESFSLFEAEKKKKEPKKEILKHLNKKERERRLDSGANLKTKVVPDKKKTYKRNKKVELDEEID